MRRPSLNPAFRRDVESPAGEEADSLILPAGNVSSPADVETGQRIDCGMVTDKKRTDVNFSSEEGASGYDCL